MQIPELVYANYMSRKQGVIPRIVGGYAQNTASATSCDAELYTVPEEFNLILCALVSRAVANATTSCTYVYAGYTDPNDVYIRFVEEYNHSIDRFHAVNWQGSLWLPPGAVLSAGGNYAASASNQANGWWQGILVPEMAT